MKGSDAYVGEADRNYKGRESYGAEIASNAWRTIQKYLKKNGKDARFSSTGLSIMDENFNGRGLARLVKTGAIDWTGSKEGKIKVYKLGDRLSGLDIDYVLGLSYGSAMLRSSKRT